MVGVVLHIRAAAHFSVLVVQPRRMVPFFDTAVADDSLGRGRMDCSQQWVRTCNQIPTYRPGYIVATDVPAPSAEISWAVFSLRGLRAEGTEKCR